MLLGNKEKTIRLHAENFLMGHITFDYGTDEDERISLSKASYDFAQKFLDWLAEEETNKETEEHKLATLNLYRHIVSWRIRGRIKGTLVDVDLESRIEEKVKEKAKLEDDIKVQKEDNLKAVKIIQEQDRQIALMESQIFFMKQGKSSGS
ncbi:MAG: hypothetical protein K8Q88_07985 [Nitrosarchaeum sp.]|nr:hypothetical protein [Nitrosarchaeum sp.]